MTTALFWVCGITSLCSMTAGPADIPSHLMATDVAGEFRLYTDVLRGTLRPSGLSFGLVPLRHVPTNTDLATFTGLLNHYRVFSANHRYVESMRALPSESTLESPNTLRVHWPSDTGRPYALTGTYHVVSANTIDLTTRVEAREALPDFDVFLASYLSPAFPASSVCVKKSETEPAFETAEPEAGVWQVFPRDAAATAIVQDGRWAIAPDVVDWSVRSPFFHPLIYRRAPDTGVVVAMMARPEDCFAVFTPHRDETHYSMYFSLFGKALKAGESAEARIRLLVGVLNDTELLQQYDAFMDSFK